MGKRERERDRDKDRERDWGSRVIGKIGAGEREREREREPQKKRGMVGERRRDRDEREKDRKRDRSGREIVRETGVGEREREIGEKEKITDTKKFMGFYLVVLYSAERSKARQWIAARQVSCFSPVTSCSMWTLDSNIYVLPL